MFRIPCFLLLGAALFGGLADAQFANITHGVPSGHCATPSLAIDVTTGVVYGCTAGNWVAPSGNGNGSSGLSAYQIAVNDGYNGTQAQWLQSLVGATGPNGLTAYQVATSNGYTGTQTQWLASLVGAAGANGTAATVQIGTVTTLGAGAKATVTNSGTATNPIFNFGIPQGAAGSGTGSGSSVFAAGCQPPLIGGTAGTAIPKGTYTYPCIFNDTGQTDTILSVVAYADTGASTIQIANSSGTNILSSALTATTSYPAGTLAVTSLSNGDRLFVTVVADGTSTTVWPIVTMSHPGVSGTETAAATLPTVATPTASPASGAVTGPTVVTLATTTSGATIYSSFAGAAYTANASPTISASGTLSYYATASGDAQSPTGSSTYTYTAPTAATPTGSISGQTITLADTTSGASIYYTTNGSTPTTSSTLYSGSIAVASGSTTSIKALAVLTGYTNSGVYSGSLTASSVSAGGPYTDNLTGTKGTALSTSFWTTVNVGNITNPITYNGADSAAGTTGSATTSSAAAAEAFYSSGTFTANQYAQTTYDGTGGGPAVRVTAGGSSYAWPLNGTGVVKFLNGAYNSAVVSGCPSLSAGQVGKLGIVGSTLTCTNVTTGVSMSDTDNGGSPISSGTPGFFLNTSSMVAGFTAGNN